MLDNYPNNNNMVKLTMLSALSQASIGNIDSMKSRIRIVKELYPNSDVSNMASHILKEINKGRKVIAGKYNFDIDTDSYNYNRVDSVKFDYIDNISKSDLLIICPKKHPYAEIYFAITSFNYSHFTQSNITITQLPLSSYNAIILTNVPDKYTYITTIFKNKELIQNSLKGAIIIPITKKNLEKLDIPTNLNKYIHGLKMHISPNLYDTIIKRWRIVDRVYSLPKY